MFIDNRLHNDELKEEWPRLPDPARRRMEADVEANRQRLHQKHASKTVKRAQAGGAAEQEISTNAMKTAAMEEDGELDVSTPTHNQDLGKGSISGPCFKENDKPQETVDGEASKAHHDRSPLEPKHKTKNKSDTLNGATAPDTSKAMEEEAIGPIDEIGAFYERRCREIERDRPMDERYARELQERLDRGESIEHIADLAHADHNEVAERRERQVEEDAELARLIANGLDLNW